MEADQHTDEIMVLEEFKIVKAECKERYNLAIQYKSFINFLKEIISYPKEWKDVPDKPYVEEHNIHDGLSEDEAELEECLRKLSLLKQEVDNENEQHLSNQQELDSEFDSLLDCMTSVSNYDFLGNKDDLNLSMLDQASKENYHVEKKLFYENETKSRELMSKLRQREEEINTASLEADNLKQPFFVHEFDSLEVENSKARIRIGKFDIVGDISSDNLQFPYLKNLKTNSQLSNLAQVCEVTHLIGPLSHHIIERNKADAALSEEIDHLQESYALDFNWETRQLRLLSGPCGSVVCSLAISPDRQISLIGVNGNIDLTNFVPPEPTQSIFQWISQLVSYCNLF